MSTTLSLQGQDFAHQLYALLQALNRAPSDDAVPTLRARAEALRVRCAELLESEAAREEAAAAMTRALNGLRRPLEELCARLAQGESAKAAFVAFRRGATPRYEAFVARLRAQRVDAPSLRPRNLARSAFHVGSALLAVACIELLPAWHQVQAVAVAFFVFSWTMEIGRRYSPAMRRLSMQLFGKFIHPHEHVRVNSATWYASALLPIALFFGPVPCVLGVLALGFGDPLAAWVGRRWGRVRLRAARSLEGTLTFAAVTFVASLALLVAAHPELSTGLRVGLAALAAVAGALTELFSGRVDDNLSIPVVVAATTAAALALAS